MGKRRETRYHQKRKWEGGVGQQQGGNNEGNALLCSGRRRVRWAAVRGRQGWEEEKYTISKASTPRSFDAIKKKLVEPSDSKGIDRFVWFYRLDRQFTRFHFFSTHFQSKFTRSDRNETVSSQIDQSDSIFKTMVKAFKDLGQFNNCFKK